MALYSHLATVRYLQGQGNAALYVRVRDGAGLYYNFVGGTWDVADGADNRVFLVEVDDASSVESRYSVSISVPEVNATLIVEYVRLSDAFVLAEEALPSRASVVVGPSGGTALTSIEAVKAYLGSTKTVDDDLFATLIVRCSTWFESQTRRVFALASYTDTFYGDGGCLYAPRQFPVQSVTSLEVNGEAVPAAVAASDNGWRLLEGIIVLRGYSFTQGCLVTIGYTAGYSLVPADVEQAVIELVCDRYRYRQRQGKTSESLGGESASYVPSTVPQSVQVVANAYRRTAV